MENDIVKIIPNAFGENLTPSIVSFDKEGTVYAGKIAKEMLISNPRNTFHEFEREMGTNVHYITEYGNSYTSIKLSAFVLKQLIADAEEYLQDKAEEAIISVPAYFTDKQRSATRIAGQMAGVLVL